MFCEYTYIYIFYIYIDKQDLPPTQDASHHQDYDIII